MFGMTKVDGLDVIQKVWNDNLGWVRIAPKNGLVWTKGLCLVKGVCEGGSSYNGFVLAIEFNM
eukprot:2108877-Amphidinium_carterae.1